MTSLLALFATGLIAGAMNAVAGGGSFVTFPALVLAGLPPVAANVSSTVALFPGGLGSIAAFRHDLRPRFLDVPLWLLGLVSAGGGLAGALLLLDTPAATFDAVIPWVLLLATLVYAFGRGLGERLGRFGVAGRGTVLAVQALLGLYGGYFGGAVGIMMMAAWTVLTTADARILNPHRSLLVNAANGAAVACFALSGQVAWPQTVATLVGAVAGGYGGALWARTLPAGVIRGCVIAISVAATVAFFAKAV